MSDNNDGFDIPVSEPLPAGVEITEVANGEKSELMQRALEDKAITEAQADKPAEWKPTFVWEVPDHALQEGQIAQHDGSNESALRISKWLNESKVSAFVVPQFGEYPAFVRIEALYNPLTAAKHDFVFLPSNGDRVEVLTDRKARLRFRVENDDALLGYSSENL